MGGNETPLINIVIQEVYRDGIIARDGRLLAGDQILQVWNLITYSVCLLTIQSLQNCLLNEMGDFPCLTMLCKC